MGENGDQCLDDCGQGQGGGGAHRRSCLLQVLLALPNQVIASANPSSAGVESPEKTPPGLNYQSEVGAGSLKTFCGRSTGWQLQDPVPTQVVVVIL